MTPVWHDGPLATLKRDGLAWDGVSPVVWSVGFEDGDRDKSARRGLAAALIGRVAGVAPGEVRLARTAAGAPVVAWPAEWHVGWSSRGARCLFGAARAPIAVDCEEIDGEGIDGEPPLWDMLTPAEACDLRRLPAGEQPRAWLRRWTIKEAHAKLVGEPRRIAPEAIETVVTDAVHATARFEGVSRCWTRDLGDAIETVALWAEGDA